MTIERFRQIVKRFHPDRNGGVMIHGAGGALAAALRQRKAQQNRFPKCRCGTTISKTAKYCRACFSKLRRVGLRLTASFVISAFFAVKLSAQPAVPPAGATQTNAPPVTYPLTLAWTYAAVTLPMSVIQATTNGSGFIFTTNRPTVLGTNRVTIPLPAGKWTITVWATDGKDTDPSASIVASRTNYVVVNEINSTDLQHWTTNRLTYAGQKRAVKEFWGHSIAEVDKWRGD